MAVRLPPPVAPSTLHAPSAQEPGFGRFGPAPDRSADQAQWRPLFRRAVGGLTQNVAHKIGTRILEHALSPVGRNQQLRKQLAKWITDRMWNTGYSYDLARLAGGRVPNPEAQRQILETAVSKALSDVGRFSRIPSSTELERAALLFDNKIRLVLAKNYRGPEPIGKFKHTIQTVSSRAGDYFRDTMNDLATEIGKNVIWGAGATGAGHAGGRGLIELKHFLERQGVND